MLSLYWILKIALAFLVSFTFSGCSLAENGKTVITPSPLSTFSADPNLELGSRNNPVALGKTVVVNNWEVQVTSVSTDARESVKKADPYADPPSPNERFLMLEITATYIGEESGDPNSDLRFKIVGSSGNSFSKSCSYSADTFAYNEETFPGAKVFGSLCFKVNADQVNGATVSVQGGYSTTDRKFISINSKS